MTRTRAARRWPALKKSVAAVLVIVGSLLFVPPTEVDSAALDGTAEANDVTVVNTLAERIDAPAPSTSQPPSVTTPEPTTPEVVVVDPQNADPWIAGPEPVPAPAAQTMLDVAYGPDAAHRLDIRLPANADAPVIVYLHSGGWIGGDRASVPDVVLRFIERGYAVVSVDYRLAPEHTFPEPVRDVKRALRWLKDYGRDSGAIDGDRMVLFGTSAGGHLASFTAATAGHYEPSDLPADLSAFDSTVAGVVSIAGPTDLAAFFEHDHPWGHDLTTAFLGCDPCAPQLLSAASPLAHLHDELPPAYWAHGESDVVVDLESQGRTIAEGWASAAGPMMSWIDIVEDTDHGLVEPRINTPWLHEFVDSAVRPAT